MKVNHLEMEMQLQTIHSHFNSFTNNIVIFLSQMVSGEEVADLLLQKSSVVHEAEACSATTSLVRLLVAGKTKVCYALP